MGFSGVVQAKGDQSVKGAPVGAEEGSVSTTLSCGECGTALRADQSWCSLCYAPVTEPFDPLTAPLDEVLGQVEGAMHDFEPSADTLSPIPEQPAQQDALAVSHLEQSTVSHSPPTIDEECEDLEDVSEIDVMLSMLAAEHKAMDPAAGLTERLGDRSTRIAVMVGGTAIIGGLLFALFTVFGAIF